MKAQIGNRSGEEYRFALENTSLCTKPNCGTSLCVQVSLLWSDFYLLSFVLSFFVNIIRYLVFHQPKLSKEEIWNLLGWEFRWGCDGLMPIGARRRRPPTIFPPTRVFTTLKANTNINSNTNIKVLVSAHFEEDALEFFAKNAVYHKVHRAVIKFVMFWRKDTTVNNHIHLLTVISKLFVCVRGWNIFPKCCKYLISVLKQKLILIGSFTNVHYNTRCYTK